MQESYTSTTSMIAVGATNSSDQRASFSSWGPYVALSAPGDSIYTLRQGGTYWSCWGTSFSSPVAAGVAALVMAAKPTLSSAQVESILFSTAADLGTAGRDPQFGYGRVNAAAAVTAALGSTSVVADTQAPTVAIVSPGASTTVSGLVPVSISASDNVGVSKVELRVNGAVLGYDSSAPFGFSWDSTKVANGMAELVAVAYDAAGNKTMSTPLNVNVSNTSNVSIALDTIAPTLTISNPIAGTTVTRTVAITALSTDNSGSAGITQTLTIDGTTVSSVTGGSLQYAWNTRKAARGQHTITIVARDARGNSTTAAVSVYK